MTGEPVYSPQRGAGDAVQPESAPCESIQPGAAHQESVQPVSAHRNIPQHKAVSAAETQHTATGATQSKIDTVKTSSHSAVRPRAEGRPPTPHKPKKARFSFSLTDKAMRKPAKVASSVADIINAPQTYAALHEPAKIVMTVADTRNTTSAHTALHKAADVAPTVTDEASAEKDLSAADVASACLPHEACGAVLPVGEVLPDAAEAVPPPSCEAVQDRAAREATSDPAEASQEVSYLTLSLGSQDMAPEAYNMSHAEEAAAEAAGEDDNASGSDAEGDTLPEEAGTYAESRVSEARDAEGHSKRQGDNAC